MTLHENIHQEIPRLEGWVSPERGCEMADLIVERRPLICVEIGVFGGRSLISQALALKQNGAGVVYGIDPWKNEAALEGENEANKDWWGKINLNDIHTGTMQAIWKLGLDERAIVIRAKSQDAKLLFQGGIHWLFLDGNHSEVSSCRDVLNYLPLLRPGGILIFDDADWPSTQTALKAVEIHCNLLRDAGGYRIYEKR